MKFICAQCDQPMSLSDSRPREQGALSITFSCPGCSREIRMLTNAGETEMVRALGVRIGPSGDEAKSKCPFSEMLSDTSTKDLPWTREASARLTSIPEFVRPMAREGIEHYARSQGYSEITEKVLDEARTEFGM